MQKFYNAKNDKVFKAIFCDPSDTELLEILMSLILNKEVKNIRFANPELLKKNVIERSKTCDFVALVDKAKVHIELNSSSPIWLHFRNLNFFSTSFNKETEVGQQYDLSTKYYHIDISYNLKNSNKLKELLEYYLQTDDQIKYVDNVKILEFNMDKIKKTWYDETDERKKKLFYYLTKFDINQEELEEKEDDAFVKKLKSKIKKLNQDKNFVSFISYEDDLKFQKNTELNLARKEGIEEGIIEGEKAGAKAKSLEIAKKMLNRGDSIEDIIDLTGLSKNEIENLK